MAQGALENMKLSLTIARWRVFSGLPATRQAVSAYQLATLRKSRRLVTILPA